MKVSKKQCKKCLKVKTKDQFYKDVKTKDNLKDVCKQCYNEKGIKSCSKCGRELHVSNFYKSKISIDGLQTYCKDCMKQYKKKLKIII